VETLFVASPAERAAETLYDQLVAKRADSLLGLCDDPDFAAGEGAAFAAMAAQVRALGPSERQLLAAVIRRAAADTLLNLLGVVTGSYGLAGADGEWTLSLDGEDVGGEMLETVLAREDAAG